MEPLPSTIGCARVGTLVGGCCVILLNLRGIGKGVDPKVKEGVEVSSTKVGECHIPGTHNVFGAWETNFFLL